MTRKNTSYPKRKRQSKKHFRLLIFLTLLIIAGSSYFYYAVIYRGKHEPEPVEASTSTQPLYSLKSRRNWLSLTPKLKAAAFNGRAAEIDYGTYVVPGLTATQTQIFGQKNSSDICTSMTPQGLAVTEDYLLVSAYCHSGTHNSVIYVIDKKNHTFVKELVLRNKSHVGGLAYDPVHQNIWISGMSRGIPQVNAITLEQLESYSFQESYQPLVYSQSYDLYAITRTSFITYHDNALYVGYFTQNTASVLEEYDIAEDGTLITQFSSDMPDMVDSFTPIALPSDMRVITEQAQGVAFYENKILFSHSYGIFPSTIQIFNNNTFQKLLEKENAESSLYLPEKLEQIYVDGEDLYVLFESAAYSYRASSLIKMDRILKLNLKTLLT